MTVTELNNNAARRMSWAQLNMMTKLNNNATIEMGWAKLNIMARLSQRALLKTWADLSKLRTKLNKWTRWAKLSKPQPRLSML